MGCWLLEVLSMLDVWRFPRLVSMLLLRLSNWFLGNSPGLPWDYQGHVTLPFCCLENLEGDGWTWHGQLGLWVSKVLERFWKGRFAIKSALSFCIDVFCKKESDLPRDSSQVLTRFNRSPKSTDATSHDLPSGCCLTLFIMSPSMWWAQAYLCRLERSNKEYCTTKGPKGTNVGNFRRITFVKSATLSWMDCFDGILTSKGTKDTTIANHIHIWPNDRIHGRQFWHYAVFLVLPRRKVYFSRNKLGKCRFLNFSHTKVPWVQCVYCRHLGLLLLPLSAIYAP